MSIPADEAAEVPAPKAGNIEVVAITDTSTAAIDTGIEQGTVWHTFLAQSNDVFIIHGEAAMAAADATTVTGNGRTWMIPANTTMDYKVNVRTRFFRAICASGDTATLRYYRSFGYGA